MSLFLIGFYKYSERLEELTSRYYGAKNFEIFNKVLLGGSQWANSLLNK
jgi:hypothetical protein